MSNYCNFLKYIYHQLDCIPSSKKKKILFYLNEIYIYVYTLLNIYVYYQVWGPK